MFGNIDILRVFDEQRGREHHDPEGRPVEEHFGPTRNGRHLSDTLLFAVAQEPAWFHDRTAADGKCDTVLVRRGDDTAPLIPAPGAQGRLQQRLSCCRTRQGLPLKSSSVPSMTPIEYESVVIGTIIIPARLPGLRCTRTKGGPFVDVDSHKSGRFGIKGSGPHGSAGPGPAEEEMEGIYDSDSHAEYPETLGDISARTISKGISINGGSAIWFFPQRTLNRPRINIDTPMVMRSETITALYFAA